MKLILFDFRCTKCKHIFEELVKPGDYWAHCPKCASNAKRMMSPFRIDRTRMAVSPSASPDSIRHFDRVHKQRRAIEEKSQQNHGDYGKAAGSD